MLSHPFHARFSMCAHVICLCCNAPGRAMASVTPWPRPAPRLLSAGASIPADSIAHCGVPATAVRHGDASPYLRQVHWKTYGARCQTNIFIAARQAAPSKRLPNRTNARGRSFNRATCPLCIYQHHIVSYHQESSAILKFHEHCWEMVIEFSYQPRLSA